MLKDWAVLRKRLSGSENWEVLAEGVDGGSDNLQVLHHHHPCESGLLG